MAGNLTRACRRILRRAVAMSTGTFCLALAAGVGAWMFATPPGIPGPAELAQALLPSTPAELRAEPVPPHRMYRVGPEEGRLLTVIAIDERTLAAARSLAADLEVQAEPRAQAAAELSQVTAATPQLRAGDRVEATISFYYCVQGEGEHPTGDGGGFCGRTFSGLFVHHGAAACAPAYLGQRFRIEGDPSGRVYVCADTGSGVHGLHRDIWFMNSDDGWLWQLSVGHAAIVEILP